MRKVLIYFLLIVLSFTLYGCNSNNEEVTDNSLSIEDKMNNIIETNNYIIVDVRSEDEYNEGHIVDSINIPYDQIDENINLDKTKTIMVYCRSGNRSSIAYNILVDLGYDVLDLGAYESINLEKE